MGIVQARLPDDLEHDLEELAEELRTSRSEVLRRALDEGLRTMRLDRALQAYAKEEITLSRAAEYVGLSIPRLAEEAADRGIPLFRQTPQDLERDIEVAREFFGPTTSNEEGP